MTIENNDLDHRICPGCHLDASVYDGPTHEYLRSSAACWRLYGEVLAREYSSPECFTVHRLTVDTYAVQHAGLSDRRVARSTCLHLCSLSLVLERGLSMDFAGKAINQLSRLPDAQILLMVPPPDPGSITVQDIATVTGVPQHQEAVHRWALSTWQAWSIHHSTIRKFIDEHELC